MKETIVIKKKEIVHGLLRLFRIIFSKTKINRGFFVKFIKKEKRKTKDKLIEKLSVVKICYFYHSRKQRKKNIKINKKNTVRLSKNNGQSLSWQAKVCLLKEQNKRKEEIIQKFQKKSELRKKKE